MINQDSAMLIGRLAILLILLDGCVYNAKDAYNMYRSYGREMRTFIIFRIIYVIFFFSGCIFTIYLIVTNK